MDFHCLLDKNRMFNGRRMSLSTATIKLTATI